MRKTKAKNDSFWQIGALPFVALWAGTYAVAWMGIWALFEWLETFASLSSQQTNLVGVTFVSLVPALLQVQVVERLLKHSMRGWMLASLLGTIISVLTFVDAGSANSRALLTVITLFVPIALTQMIWLWRRVNAAWLWALASLVAGIVFSIPMRNANGSVMAVIFAGLLYGVVQGGIMRYLWMQPKGEDKRKHESIEDEAISQARLSRLQDTSKSEDGFTSWPYADDQAQQSQA